MKPTHQSRPHMKLFGFLRECILLRPAPHSSATAAKLPAIGRVVTDTVAVLIDKAGAWTCVGQVSMR